MRPNPESVGRAKKAAQARAGLKLERLLDLLPVGVVTLDAKRCITSVNAAAARLIGQPEEALLEKPLPIRSPAEVSAWEHALEHARAGISAPVTLQVHELNGRRSVFELRATTFENRETSGYVVVIEDVTVRVETEERQALVMEAAAALAAPLDYRTTLKSLAKLMVPRFADWCAIEMHEGDQPIPELLTVAHSNPEKAHLAYEYRRRFPPRREDPYGPLAVLRSNKAQLIPELTEEDWTRNAESPEHLDILFKMEIRSALLLPISARGHSLGVLTLIYSQPGRRYTEKDVVFLEDLARRVGIMIDNARLYAAEQQARKVADAANHTKDLFLATVSHELRTPLNAIVGWAHLMRSGRLDDARRERAAETIERNAMAMTQLIDDLLDVSRIIGGRMRLELAPHSPADIVASVVQTARPDAENKGVRLDVELDPESGLVLADPGRLEQVVWNLLSNAIKFTPSGGRVQVRLRRVDALVELEVRDTGKGIAPEFLPHIFEPFQQAAGSSTKARAGLGLGLAIARHLVELHGGRIEAESPGPGKGACFRVLLPARIEPVVLERPTPTAAPPQSSALPDLSGIHVLAVDDDADARDLLRAVLEGSSARVTTAESAPDAMRRLEHDVPDVLLSDIAMPGEDGYQLLRKVRALPADRGGCVPAAALTAFARATDRSRALRTGFDVHLSKPIDPAELVQVVARLAREPREQQARS